MAKTKHVDTAERIIANLGGEQNLQQVRHCATRLRCVVADGSKVDKAARESTPGVISVVNAGGQTQVAIGNDVIAAVYKAVMDRYPSLAEEGRSGSSDAQKAGGNPVTRFIDAVSSIFVPTLTVLSTYKKAPSTDTKRTPSTGTAKSVRATERIWHPCLLRPVADRFPAHC